jgi:hypothetical protein
MKVSRLFSCNNEILHVRNFTAKTIIAQIIVMARIPLAALSISNLLQIRKTKIFGKTHKVIECVIILESLSLERYEPSEVSPDEKRKTMIPMTNGKTNPLIRPVISLSYFSGIVIS